MIEIIDDGDQSSVMVYTDEAVIAKALRREFEMSGATYHGRGIGFSWRVSRPEARVACKRLRLRPRWIFACKNKGNSEDYFSEIA